MVWRVGERVTITLIGKSEAVPPKAHEFMLGRTPRTTQTVFGLRQEDGFETAFFSGVTIEIVAGSGRSEEHTSELQSLMRISYAVFCLKKKKHKPYTAKGHQTKT